MLKRVILSGLLGGVVLTLWSFLVNGFFGFTMRLEGNRVPNESAVYAVLKDNVVVPGGYIANPPIVPGAGFPAGEPVFGVRYGGVGHEAAGRLLAVDLAVAFAAATLMALLLSMSSARIRSRWSSRFLFVVAIALLLAIYGDVPEAGIGGYPALTALLIAGNHLVSWVLAGAVIAWGMRGSAVPGVRPEATTSARDVVHR